MKYLIKRILALFLCAVFLAGCEDAAAKWEQIYSSESKDTEVSDTSEEGSAKTETETEDMQDEGSKKAPADERDTSILVHVCGAVTNPGVYELPKGARVNQAIEAAGGLTEEADLVLVNQARIVEDGEQIRIYTKEEAVNAEVQAAKMEGIGGTVKINLNTADADTLMTLPGIGEAKADAIIEYRESNGGFKSIDDIKNIPGIKDAVFSKIKDKITV